MVILIKVPHMYRAIFLQENILMSLPGEADPLMHRTQQSAVRVVESI